MSYYPKNFLKIGVVTVAAVLILGPAFAVAQRSSGGVTGGARQHPGTWSQQRSSRSVRHARDYARDIYRYSRDADRIEPTVAKSESEELGRNIAKAQSDLSTARKEAGNDAQTLAALKAIEQHLATAAEHHKMLHEECCKSSVDGMVCMDCCNKIIKELDQAQAEQDALIRSMEMKGTASGGASSAVHPHH